MSGQQKQMGRCVHLLYQAHLIYSETPYKSVFLLLVITDISEIKKMHKNFHFYSGDDSRSFATLMKNSL